MRAVLDTAVLIGDHRAPSIPDLIIAATAEPPARTLVHADKDFEVVSAISSLATVRLEGA